jgi:hypothetical protein
MPSARLRSVLTGYSAASTARQGAACAGPCSKRRANATRSMAGASRAVLCGDRVHPRLGTTPDAYSSATANERPALTPGSACRYRSTASRHAVAAADGNGAGIYTASAIGPCQRSASTRMNGSLHAPCAAAQPPVRCRTGRCHRSMHAAVACAGDCAGDYSGGAHLSGLACSSITTSVSRSPGVLAPLS